MNRETQTVDRFFPVCAELTGRVRVTCGTVITKTCAHVPHVHEQNIPVNPNILQEKNVHDYNQEESNSLVVNWIQNERKWRKDGVKLRVLQGVSPQNTDKQNKQKVPMQPLSAQTKKACWSERRKHDVTCQEARRTCRLLHLKRHHGVSSSVPAVPASSLLLLRETI